MRLRSIATLTACALALACDEGRGSSRASGSTTPSCSLPVCGACACDLTTVCDQGCGDCDPECGACRAEGAACRMTPDAGPPRDAALPADATTQGGDGGVLPPPRDAGPCAEPVSQPLSAPCCVGHGIDACGAALFCAALDGRTQPTCYPERSRQLGESCTGERQCRSGAFCFDGACEEEYSRGPGAACSVDLQCRSHRCLGSGTCASTAGDPCGGAEAPCGLTEGGAPTFCDRWDEICLEATPEDCDLETHAPCVPSDACHISRWDLVSRPVGVCIEAGTGTQGSTCAAPGDCARGFECLRLSEEGDSQCLALCSARVPCAQGQCNCFGDESCERLGFCGVP